MALNKLKTYGELVMFSHTLFSLPFGLIAMLWAADGLPPMRIFFWIMMALIGARNGANALNRIIDKSIDTRNPRTANRHMPMGKVKDSEVIILIIGCFMLLTLSAFMLNPLCVKLLPLAVFLFIVYSYTKRFTWACHIVLGIACGGAPVGAWIAVRGEIGWTAIVLGAVVTLWVSGFDIIYGSQDVDFDKKEGLYSIPVRFGVKGALLISSLFHLMAIVLLIYLYFIVNANWLYLLGIILVACLMTLEHIIVKPDNLKNVKIASYSINQIIGIVFLIFTAADIFLLR